jgi:beta-phosphoglucomutase
MLQAIVFDFDGVLVDSEPLHYEAFARTVEPLGARFDYEHYRRHYIGYDDRDGFRAICNEFNIPLDEQRLAELIAEKAAAFARIVGRGVTPMPGAVELVQESAAAMPIALCSGALLQDIALILPNLGPGGLMDLFRAIVTADDVRRSKPDPEGYALAARRLGLAPGHCLAVEDTPAGIASARVAGLHTLAVSTSFPLQELSEADRSVASLASVTVPKLRSWFNGCVRTL